MIQVEKSKFNKWLKLQKKFQIYKIEILLIKVPLEGVLVTDFKEKNCL